MMIQATTQQLQGVKTQLFNICKKNGKVSDHDFDKELQKSNLPLSSFKTRNGICFDKRV